MSGPAGPVTGLVAGVAATLSSSGLLRRHPPGGARRWARTNHAGHPVTLLEGPAVVAGIALGALAGGSAGRDVGRGAPVALATLVAGGVGALDDLTGDTATKGLRGHLGALRRGEVTTGVLKIAGLAAAGALVASTAPDLRHPGGGDLTWSPLGLVRTGLALGVDAGVVAGSANLLNLLDLRPGRALKVAVAAGVPLAATGSAAAGAVVGAALAALPADLAGERMLGDTGAGALGAALGAAVVAHTPRPARAALLAGLVGLTLASERVSFTRVIESTPVLRELDAWGRTPPSSRQGSPTPVGDAS